ncbi:hypothetical protein B0H63DRAFT_269084 [Podospora didyma]|uniref:Uncharacterized protein n=1 Tax=Podospora didyma TaxID=330526 RepID=A0AAE0KEF4_9PEZI|nr:hypothetical protein B0H63DRAFT_269084 [Podospora didyma]
MKSAASNGNGQSKQTHRLRVVFLSHCHWVNPSSSIPHGGVSCLALSSNAAMQWQTCRRMLVARDEMMCVGGAFCILCSVRGSSMAGQLVGHCSAASAPQKGSLFQMWGEGDRLQSLQQLSLSSPQEKPNNHNKSRPKERLDITDVHECFHIQSIAPHWCFLQSSRPRSRGDPVTACRQPTETNWAPPAIIDWFSVAIDPSPEWSMAEPLRNRSL